VALFWPAPFHVGQRRKRPFDVNEKPFESRAVGAGVSVLRQHREKSPGAGWNGLQILASRRHSNRGLERTFTWGGDPSLDYSI
jgi:hypothetical protein